MNLIVYCKLVMDPEASPSSFKLDTYTNKMEPQPGFVRPVISPFDEHAVEAALRINDTLPSTWRLPSRALSNTWPDAPAQSPLWPSIKMKKQISSKKPIMA